MSMIRSLALAAAGLVAAGGAAAQAKWDLATAYPATNFHTENINQFAADIDKASGGKLKITVHANASLFKAPEIKRAVQGGQAQAGEVLLVNFQNEWQVFGADGLPFLADSYAEAMKLYRAQKPLLEKKLAEQGMMLLYSVPWPPQGIYSKKPLATAADLKGIKWRAYSPATARIAELVGAQPVTVQAAEVSQAWPPAWSKAYMSSGSTGWDAKLHEHVKYWYDTQAWLPKNASSSTRGLRRAGQATQAAVQKAAADAETRGWAASQEGQRRDAGQAQGRRHADPAARARAQGRHEEGRRHHAQGMAGQGRPRRQAAGRRLLEVGRPCARPRCPLRRGRLAGGAVHGRAAGGMVLLSILGRAAALPRQGHRRLRRLLHGRRRLPGAGPHAQARRAHPRDAAAVALWAAGPPRPRDLVAGRGRAAVRPARLLRLPAGLAVATPSTTSPPATTPRRCGSRSSPWRLGMVVLSSPSSTSSSASCAAARARHPGRCCAMNDLLVTVACSSWRCSPSWAAASGSASRCRAWPGSACSCSPRARPATPWPSPSGARRQLDADRAAAVRVDGRNPVSHAAVGQTCSGPGAVDAQAAWAAAAHQRGGLHHLCRGLGLVSAATCATIGKMTCPS
jgi:TRAP-type C4-dicarboxylate transport system substrate-binding protein